MIITYGEALRRLNPESEFVIKEPGYEGLFVLNGQKPSQEDLDAEIELLQAELAAKEYQYQRASNYPEIGNQLDMLWHAIDNGTLNKTSDFYTAIKAVKDAYPKSE
jgi:hypothetical protein